MLTLLEIAKWVGILGTAVSVLWGGWKFITKYNEYRKTKNSIAKVKAKLQSLGIVTSESIGDLVKHLVDKGIDKPAGPDGPATRLTCTQETGNHIAHALDDLMKLPAPPTGRAVLSSPMVICLSFIDEVLDTLNPVRMAGEPVADSDEGWVLERLIGIDHLGEVWRGIRSEFRGVATIPPHQIRAFRFFTKDSSREKILTALRDLNGTLTTLGAHPHIVHFHHLAVHDNKFPYIALEFVPGGSLDDWIMERPEQRVPLRKHEIIRGIVSALAKAHESGIQHHDLSPRKVLLTERFEPEERNKKPRVYDVQARIADFGLADITAGALSSNSQNSGRSTAAATRFAAQYLPPEADQDDKRSAAQDDVFALGVIWYQLLAERMERPPYDFAERLRDLGHDDETIGRISRCLAHPDRRYKDTRQLEDDLDTRVLPDWPEWPPTPKGLFDVSHLVRDYIAVLG